MNEQQKLLIRTLIDLSYDCGFCYFSISLLAEKTGIPAQEIYDNNTNTGHLWEFDPRVSSGEICLFFLPSEESWGVAVPQDDFELANLKRKTGY